MSIKLADRVGALEPSITLSITQRAREMKNSGIDVVGFGAGEPDFDTPRGIKEAGVKAINEGFTKYTPASGMPELKKAICEKFARDNSLEYSPDQIVVSCGAKHSLYNIFQAICDKGDEVLIISPYWVSYPEMVRLAEARPVYVGSDESKSFVPDPGDIKKAVTSRTKALILNSPSNPTGAVFGREFLKNVADIALNSDFYVISDEIYEELIYDAAAKHYSIASFGEKIKDRVFTVNGVSKTYSMTGWRIGYAAGPVKAMKKINALQSHSTSNPSSVSQKAALFALSGAGKETAIMKNEFKKRLDFMVKRIGSMKKISVFRPAGAFYLFCNIRHTGIGSVDFAKRLLEEAHVACVPGSAFGSDDHVRLSFATGMPSIEKGLDRIEKWLEKL